MNVVLFQKLSYVCKQTLTQNKGSNQYKSKTQFLLIDIIQLNENFTFTLSWYKINF